MGKGQVDPTAKEEVTVTFYYMQIHSYNGVSFRDRTGH